MPFLLSLTLLLRPSLTRKDFPTFVVPPVQCLLRTAFYQHCCTTFFCAFRRLLPFAFCSRSLAAARTATRRTTAAQYTTLLPLRATFPFLPHCLRYRHRPLYFPTRHPYLNHLLRTRTHTAPAAAPHHCATPPHTPFPLPAHHPPTTTLFLTLSVRFLRATRTPLQPAAFIRWVPHLLPYRLPTADTLPCLCHFADTLQRPSSPCTRLFLLQCFRVGCWFRRLYYVH